MSQNFAVSLVFGTESRLFLTQLLALSVFANWTKASGLCRRRTGATPFHLSQEEEEKKREVPRNTIAVRNTYHNTNTSLGCKYISPAHNSLMPKSLDFMARQHQQPGQSQHCGLLCISTWTNESTTVRRSVYGS